MATDSAGCQSGNRWAAERLIALGLVWPLSVVVGDEFEDQVVQMSSAENRKMIQALDLQGLRPAFGVSVQVGAACWQTANLGCQWALENRPGMGASKPAS